MNLVLQANSISAKSRVLICVLLRPHQQYTHYLFHAFLTALTPASHNSGEHCLIHKLSPAFASLSCGFTTALRAKCSVVVTSTLCDQ